MQLWHDLENDLKRREAGHLRRELRLMPRGALDLASNDYLGLSTHPEVVAAACDAARQFGTGARASRLVSGHLELHQKLESELARFKGTAAALIFSSGYAANLSLILALSNEQTALFCHKRNHASLIDACRFAQNSGSSLRFFESDQKLRQLLQNSTQPRKLIVADAVFSMDGDLCDLPALLELAREFDAHILLDDAHGTGTLGATGRGTAEHFQLHDERIIPVGTLSKALGSQGGFVAGPQILIDTLVNTARPFIYSTALNPPAVGAALKSLELIQRDPVRIQNCRHNVQFLAQELQQLGFDARQQPSPILPVVIGTEEQALKASSQLEALGLWCPAIRPPTVAPGTSRLRIAVNASWTAEELHRIVAAFAQLSKKVGP